MMELSARYYVSISFARTDADGRNANIAKQYTGGGKRATFNWGNFPSAMFVKRAYNFL